MQLDIILNFFTGAADTPESPVNYNLKAMWYVHLNLYVRGPAAFPHLCVVRTATARLGNTKLQFHVCQAMDAVLNVTFLILFFSELGYSVLAACALILILLIEAPLHNAAALH